MNLKSKLKKNLAKNLILIAMLSAVGTFSVVPSSLSLPSYAAPLSNSQMEEDYIDVDAERANINAERAEIRVERANINTEIDNINARRARIKEAKKPLKAIAKNIQTAINTVDSILLYRAAKIPGASERLGEITKYANGLLANHVSCIIESTDPYEFKHCFGTFMQDFIDNPNFCLPVKDDTEEEEDNNNNNNNNNNNDNNDPAALSRNFTAGVWNPRRAGLIARMAALNDGQIRPLNDQIEALNKRIEALNARIRAVNARQENLNALIAEQEQILRDINAM